MDSEVGTLIFLIYMNIYIYMDAYECVSYLFTEFFVSYVVISQSSVPVEEAATAKIACRLPDGSTIKV